MVSPHHRHSGESDEATPCGLSTVRVEEDSLVTGGSRAGRREASTTARSLAARGGTSGGSSGGSSMDHRGLRRTLSPCKQDLSAPSGTPRRKSKGCWFESNRGSHAAGRTLPSPSEAVAP